MFVLITKTKKIDHAINKLYYIFIKLLDDKSKISFISTCQKTRTFLKNPYCTFTFDDIYRYNKVKHLNYLNKFSKIKYISINSKKKIPNNVTHLILSENFKQPIYGYIPNSVTHLTLVDWFDRPIEGCIPNSVTHLIFGDWFNQSIKNCIPNSVTHLKFGGDLDQRIKGCIPASVTHLETGNNSDFPMIKYIPDNVIYLKLLNDESYYQRFMEWDEEWDIEWDS
ncbi:fnip repeat-containing protein [Moumouvirus maliensis]|nr:fnip repeat-containing protein [Moumouvirus maliensis]